MGAKTEDKGASTSRSISSLASEFEVVPGVIYGVLNEFGIPHEGDVFTADDDAYELVQTALLDNENSKLVTLKKGITPRDFAIAINVPAAEVETFS